MNFRLFGGPKDGTMLAFPGRPIYVYTQELPPLPPSTSFAHGDLLAWDAPAGVRHEYVALPYTGICDVLDSNAAVYAADMIGPDSVAHKRARRFMRYLAWKAVEDRDRMIAGIANDRARLLSALAATDADYRPDLHGVPA